MSTPEFDPETQLAMISEISTAFSAEGIEHWLFGGWGLDFLAGKITRPHDDIDFFIWDGDFDKALKVLAPLGYEFRPEASGDFVNESGFVRKDGYYVELARLVRKADGSIATPGRYLDWPWPTRSFEGPPLSFRGITVPGWDAYGHWHIKMGFSRHGSKDPLREQDISDIEILKSLTGDLSELPEFRQDS
jgi:hypothetical protein